MESSLNTWPLIVWILPFAGAVFLWAFGPQLKRLAGPLATAVLGAAFVATLALWPAVAAQPGGVHVALWEWAPGISLGLLVDRLAFIWLSIITGVGFLIHLYSIGYLAGDRAEARFFSYLNFFIFAMLTLVLADNFVFLLVGWGLVGLASFWLIGFWTERPSAVEAARKAFVMNVVGDVGILLAIFAIYGTFGSLSYADVFAKAAQGPPAIMTLIALGLLVGAAAKSAQVPLHTWLADAMEGPTPVSALIHAATMVTAGVYLVARCWPIYQHAPGAMETVGVVGAVTALAGALLGVVQWDIKRILAYSTMSQIGYMIMGVGVGAYSAGVLHFYTHAFFKACLFLASGIIIHNLAGEQDVRKMGGLAKKMPVAFWSMLAATCAITGVPLFSGWVSKDAVVYQTLALGHPILWALGVLAAALTAYYMSRMMWITFAGEYRGDPHAGEHGHGPHVPAWVMGLPVAVLGVGSVVIGWLNWPVESFARFLAPVFNGAPEVPVGAWGGEFLSTQLPLLAALIVGAGLAYLQYGTAAALADAPDRLEREAKTQPAFLVKLFYWNELLDALFTVPARAIGTWFARVLDPKVIDAVLVRDVATDAGILGLLFRRWQSGLVRTYALTLLCGAAAMIVYFAVVR
ncbi:MAG TPA: NADH-quinone oxidoreductase subunit L [Candidatus Dormibacteraeota bacterium]|nr:NADH-quinone oxidoreductase subunit L [Candidatus Dormibacteraeota bacterium]